MRNYHYRYASEDDEDDPGHELPGMMIMIGLQHPRGGLDPRLADESRRSDSTDLPNMSKKELDQRIICLELELGCYRALRDGNRKTALECNAELQEEDQKLAKMIANQTNKRGDDDDEQ
jgi:hypothetical protein